jgi:fatty-acid desaturase
VGRLFAVLLFRFIINSLMASGIGVNLHRIASHRIRMVFPLLDPDVKFVDCVGRFMDYDLYI